jgi:hypothetical protein
MRPTAENLPVLDFSVEDARARDAATPSRWSIDDWRDEVRLDQLSEGDRILATTGNHTYEIVVTSPGTSEVLVRGGHFFPGFTQASLSGSTLGGSFLKMRTVCVGGRLEFAFGTTLVVTTRVRTVRVVHAAASRRAM